MAKKKASLKNTSNAASKKLITEGVGLSIKDAAKLNANELGNLVTLIKSNLKEKGLPLNLFKQAIKLGIKNAADLDLDGLKKAVKDAKAALKDKDSSLIEKVKAVLGSLFIVDVKVIDGRKYYGIFFKHFKRPVLRGNQGYVDSKVFDEVALHITKRDRWGVNGSYYVKKKGVLKRLFDNHKNQEQNG